MKKQCIFLILMFLLLSAGSISAETGKAGMAGAFLKFGQGARALGMGRAFCSIAEGIDAIFYNPAGLAYSTKKQAGFTYHSLTLDRKLNSVALAFPVRNEAVMGIAWVNSSVGNVIMRDSDRNPYDEFKNSDNVISLSFAKKFNNAYSFGGNLRYLQTKLDDLNSYTVGVDLGGYLKINRIFTAGLAIQDLGSDYRWDSTNYWSGSKGSSYNDKIPFKIRSGVSGSFIDKTLVTSFDIVKVDKLDLKVNAGAEYWILKQVSLVVPDEEAEDELTEVVSQKRLFGIRTGYSDGSYTFGMSLYYPYGNLNGGFDYAYLTGKLNEGSYHILTVRVMF